MGNPVECRLRFSIDRTIMEIIENNPCPGMQRCSHSLTWRSIGPQPKNNATLPSLYLRRSGPGLVHRVKNVASLVLFLLFLLFFFFCAETQKRPEKDAFFTYLDYSEPGVQKIIVQEFARSRWPMWTMCRFQFFESFLCAHPHTTFDVQEDTRKWALSVYTHTHTSSCLYTRE